MWDEQLSFADADPHLLPRQVGGGGLEFLAKYFRKKIRENGEKFTKNWTVDKVENVLMGKFLKIGWSGLIFGKNGKISRKFDQKSLVELE